MTREEFYEKYGDVVVKFISYYKYTFTYGASFADGKRLLCHYGGNSDEIYRFEMVDGEEILLKNLEPYSGEVYDSNHKLLDEFYDY